MSARIAGQYPLTILHKEKEKAQILNLNRLLKDDSKVKQLY